MSPRPGGETAKFGERYEGRWTVHELLKVLEGRARSITVEEVGRDGAGIEFALMRNDGVTEAHQVKRQHGDANRWTIRRLAEVGVLAAAAAQIEQGREFHFVSILPSQRLSDMTDRARGADDLSTLMESLNKDQAGDFETLATIAGGEAEAFCLLRSLYVRWPDERHVEEANASRAGSLIDGAPAPTASLALGDLVRDNLGRTLDSATIRAKLAKYELGVIDLASAGKDQVGGRVEAARESWEIGFATELLEPEIPRVEAGEIALALEAREGGAVLVAGPAGAGKSGVLHQVVSDLSERWPVLPLRLDRIEPFSSTHELGVERLGLPASPPASLAMLAGDRDCLLVIDQLDIVSRASGRMPETFDAVANLFREAAAYPNMRVLAACRKFDLDNDRRLRRLVGHPEALADFSVAPLSDEEVEDAVLSIGFRPDALTSEQWELLRSPLHLVLLHAIAADGRAPDFATSKDLLDAFWVEKRRLCRARRETTRFADTIGALTDYMSANQRLAAPEAVLDAGDLLDDADVLASEHVVISEGGSVAFFHEAFFDYAFARRWIVRSESVAEFLRSGEQELFRRGQVRQVLAHLRESDPDQFVAEVEQLLDAPDVRSHIKDLVIGILRALPDPSAAEWRLLKRRLGRRSPSAAQLWPVLRTKPWFRRLTAEGVLKNWLASEDDELRDHALEIAAEAPEDEAGRVIELLAPYANQPGFDELARRMVEAGSGHLPSILEAASLELEEEGADGSENAVVAALWEEGGRLARERDARQPDYSPADVDEIPSPIPAAEASEMSDAEWQLAIAEYGDDHDGQSPVGGAEELARVLENRTNSEPNRFARLGLTLDASVNPVYLNAILHALGNARKVESGLVFDVARHAASLGRPEHDYGISWALHDLLGRDAPADVVELVIDRALHSPDPSDPSIPDALGDRHYKYNEMRESHLRGGSFPARVGTARAQAFVTLAHLLADDPDGHWTSVLVPSFAQFASDPDLRVRSSVARLLSAAWRHAPDAVLASFPQLIDCDDELLASHPVRALVMEIGDDEIAQPVIERMLASENREVREAGGELTAYAAAELGRGDLLAGTFDADAAVRKGAAFECSWILPEASDDEPLRAALIRFFDDDDPEVRSAATYAVVNVRQEKLEGQVELIEALIASRAFDDGLLELLETLEEIEGDPDELVLLTARRFLDRHGDSLDPITDLGLAVIAEKLGELVARGYSQAPGAESRSRFLDLIDELLEAGAYGFSDLIGGAER